MGFKREPVMGEMVLGLVCAQGLKTSIASGTHVPLVALPPRADGRGVAAGKHRWAVNSIGAVMMMQQLAVPSAAQSTFRIADGCLEWQGEDDLQREHSTAPPRVEAPDPSASSAIGVKRKSRRGVEPLVEGPVAPRGVGRVAIQNKEDVFEWLKDNPAALKELLGRNVTIVGDAVHEMGEFEGVRASVVICTLEQALT